MKKCDACGRHIDIRVHPYANIYRQAQSGNMQTYHLDCLVKLISRELNVTPRGSRVLQGSKISPDALEVGNRVFSEVYGQSPRNEDEALE